MRTWVSLGSLTRTGRSSSFDARREPGSREHSLWRNTHDDTLRIIKKYANQQLRITTFNQSRYPRIHKETLLPLAKSADDDKALWYPPGHGDLYNAITQSGVLDQLLAEGKEYLFVSNSDNLGAVFVFITIDVGIVVCVND